MSDDDSIAEGFDQTNGVVSGLEGDSDGTAAGDDYSAEDRDLEDPTIDDADLGSDRDGAEDVIDPNP